MSTIMKKPSHNPLTQNLNLSIMSDRKENGQKIKISVQADQNNLQFYLQHMHGDIPTMNHHARDLILEAQNKISWADQFTDKLIVTTMDFDDESMSLLLHYGNYKMVISAIMTSLDDKILSTQIFDSGSFGEIYEVQDFGKNLVVKGVSYVTTQGKLMIDKIYKQYFLSKICSCLRVGPKLSEYLGYDIVFFKSKACFAMEMCSSSFFDLLNTQKDLLQNLQLLHSIGFIHLDIKPENTAYSQEFKRNVFIDFGFSKLIQEPLGKKTFTYFYGTVCFCSEQMKDLYYIGIPGYIDLYYNDIVSLAKTFLKKKQYFDITKKLLEDAKEIQSKKEKNTINSIFASTIILIRLKFFLWIDSLPQIIELLKCTHQIPFTIHSILSSNLLKRFKQNKQIDAMLANLKKLIIDKNMNTSTEDKYFLDYFKIVSDTHLTPTVLSIDRILSLSSESFGKFIDNLDWIQKLFCVINPFSNYFNMGSSSSQLFLNAYEERKRVINKIYEYIQPNFGSIESSFQLERSWIVMKYIYSRLKALKNRKLLTVLRMIFILTTDLDKVQEISNQIIDYTQGQKDKLLTIIEYQLFYDIGLKYLEPVSQKYIRIVSSVREEGDEELKLIKNFAFQILNRERRYYEEYSKEKILPLLSQIQQTPSLKQAVCHIKFLYQYLSRSQIGISEKIEKSKDYKNKVLTQKIYSIYFEPYIFSHIERSQYYFFYLLFKPMSLCSKLSFNEEKLIASLDEMFRVKKQMKKTWVNLIDYEGDEILLNQPRLLLYTVKQCVGLIPNMKKNRINCYYMLGNIFKFLDLSIRLTTLPSKKEISNQVFSQIQKLYQSLEQVYRTQWSQQWLYISLCSLKGIFLLVKGQSQKVIEQKANEVFSMRTIVKQMNSQVIYFYLSFFTSFEGYIKSSQEEHFIERYILIVNDLFYSEKFTIVYRINNQFLRIVFLVNCKKKLYMKNFELLEKLAKLHDVQEMANNFYDPISWYVIQYSLEILCSYTPEHLLVDYFSRLILKPLHLLIIQQSYIEYHLLFYKTRLLSKFVNIKVEIVRLFTILIGTKAQKVKHMQRGVYKMYRQFIEYSTQRKKVICLKRQKNYYELCRLLKKRSKAFTEKIKNSFANKVGKIKKFIRN